MNQIPATAIRRRTFLKASLTASGLLAAGFLPAACGSGSGTSEASTLRLGVPTDVQLANPQAFLAPNQVLRQTIFDYLIDKRPDGSYEPSLAREWTWNDDQTQLVLALRDDVTFHSGRDFGPDDVIASIESALEEDSGVQVGTLLSRATAVEATGPAEVTVTFEEPSYPFLDAISILPIIDSETYPNIANGEEVVGTGPFTWKSWSPGNQIELERNDSYWNGEPEFQEVVIRVISEPEALIAAARSGELDMIHRMTPRDATRLAEDDWAIDTSEGFDVYVGANIEVTPLDNITVRQAIAYALDRERIADQVYSGLAQPSCVPWSGNVPGVTEEQQTRYTYDVARGRSLLEQAGAVGAEVALSSFAADPAYGAAAEIVQFGLEEIGLTVRPVAYDQAEFVERLQAATMPGLWVTPIALTAMGPTTALSTAFPLRVGKNTHNVTDPEYETLVNALLAASSEDEQATATAALTEYMLEQAYHNTFVQAQTPTARVSELTGNDVDLTLALDISTATLKA